MATNVGLIPPDKSEIPICRSFRQIFFYPSTETEKHFSHGTTLCSMEKKANNMDQKPRMEPLDHSIVIDHIKVCMSTDDEL